MSTYKKTRGHLLSLILEVDMLSIILITLLGITVMLLSRNVNNRISLMQDGFMLHNEGIHSRIDSLISRVDILGSAQERLQNDFDYALRNIGLDTTSLSDRITLLENVVIGPQDADGIRHLSVEQTQRLVNPNYDHSCECDRFMSCDICNPLSEGPSCSLCDALGHGYPGGGPCPLEETGEPEPIEEPF